MRRRFLQFPVTCVDLAHDMAQVQVAVACHVPKDLAAEKELGAKDWFETVTKAMQGEVEINEQSDEMIIGVCKGSMEKELFPLKMRDAGSSAGYQMLLKQGLIPQDGARACCNCWRRTSPATGRTDVIAECHALEIADNVLASVSV
jgi:hypothetical protein